MKYERAERGTRNAITLHCQSIVFDHSVRSLSRACDSILEQSEGERAAKYVSNLAARALTFAFHRLHRPQMTSAHIKQIRPASLLNPQSLLFETLFISLLTQTTKAFHWFEKGIDARFNNIPGESFQMNCNRLSNESQLTVEQTFDRRTSKELIFGEERGHYTAVGSCSENGSSRGKTWTVV